MAFEMNDEGTGGFLEKKGFELGKLLGYGAEGFVYALPEHPGLVVKITESSQEYDLFKYLSKQKSYPFFFPRVKKLMERKSANYPYIIIREDVPDITRRAYKKLDQDFELLNGHNLEWQTAEFKSDKKHWFKRVRSWCVRNRWKFHDFHDENVGLRNKTTLVIRDLGLTSRYEE